MIDDSIEYIYAVLPAGLLFPEYDGELLRVVYLRLREEEVTSAEHPVSLSESDSFIFESKLLGKFTLEVNNPLSLLEKLIAMANNGHADDIRISIGRVYREVDTSSAIKESKPTLYFQPPTVNHDHDHHNHDSNGSSKNEHDLTHCPSCGAQLVYQEGCLKCPSCGWSACSVS